MADSKDNGIDRGPVAAFELATNLTWLHMQRESDWADIDTEDDMEDWSPGETGHFLSNLDPKKPLTIPTLRPRTEKIARACLESLDVMESMFRHKTEFPAIQAEFQAKCDLVSELRDAILVAEKAFKAAYGSEQHQKLIRARNRYDAPEFSYENRMGMLKNSPLMNDSWRLVRKWVAALRAELPSMMKNAFDQARQLLYEDGDIADTFDSPMSQVVKPLQDTGDLLPDHEFTDLSYSDFASDVQILKLRQQTQQEPGYLGISYDEVKHQVTRNSDSVDINGPISWRLIRKLIETEAYFLPRHQIERCWSSEAGTYEDPAKDPPSKDAVNTAISHLRDKISILGLEIENLRYKGWRLISVGEQ